MMEMGMWRIGVKMDNVRYEWEPCTMEDHLRRQGLTGDVCPNYSILATPFYTPRYRFDFNPYDFFQSLPQRFFDNFEEALIQLPHPDVPHFHIDHIDVSPPNFLPDLTQMLIVA